MGLHFIAILVARLSQLASKLLKQGSGSSLPGKLALAIDKQLFKTLSQQLKEVIVVTGTNGKSTTSGLLAQFSEALNQTPIIHNHLGANMKNGLATSLINHSKLNGKLKTHFAVLEIDEATLPQVSEALSQQLSVVTNLFRDQLDRYGELDTTAKLIASGIEKSGGQLLLNANDPIVRFIQNQLSDKHETYYYGFSETLAKSLTQKNNLPKLLEAVCIPKEVTDCPACGNKLHYASQIYGHLGHYQCQACGFKHPNPATVELMTIEETPQHTFKLGLQINHPAYNESTGFYFESALSGLFNIYNVLGALSACIVKKLPKPLNAKEIESLQATLKKYHSIFGRSQAIAYCQKHVMLYLIKNPIGASEVLETVAQNPKRTVMLAINDLAADGRDISWLWDAPFEYLADFENTAFLIVSGTRAADMALRLEYAGVSPQAIQMIADPIAALNALVERTPEDHTAYVLPTYTALLKLSQHLSLR